MFSVRHLVVFVVIFAGLAAVLLLLLWPRKHSGQRLLRNWGVAAPTDEQCALARRYLLVRRVLYVVCVVLAGPVAGAWPPPSRPFAYVGCFLAALLLAELIAMVRPVHGATRVATLHRRGVRDLLPTWMIAVYGVAVALAVAGVSLMPPKGGGLWLLLPAVAGSAVAVAAVVWLAVARPAIGDPAVDAALRQRSARVAAGLGTVFAATVLAVALGTRAPALGVLAQVLGLAGWGLMVSVTAFRSGLRSEPWPSRS